MRNFENSIQKHRLRVNEQKAVLVHLKKEVAQHKQKVKELKKSIPLHEKALEVVKEIGRKTQEAIQIHISSIASLALDSVMEDPYQLVLDFVERRDKIECDIFFKREDQLLSPLDSSGYGAVDIASFAIRIAIWKMQNPQKRNTIILDEPFKNLDKTKQEKASYILKRISHELGIQFIIVTHEDKLTQAADKIFQVSKKGRVSHVEVL